MTRKQRNEITNKAAINCYLLSSLLLENIDLVLHEVAVSKIVDAGNVTVDKRAERIQFLFDQLKTATKITFADFETHLKDKKKMKEMKAKLEEILEKIWE